MPAARHINPQQLTMFEPAWKLANPDHIPSVEVLGFDTTHEALHREKIADARRAPADSAWNVNGREPGEETFYENVAREGVKEPVGLAPLNRRGPTHLFNGNHRVAVMKEVNPNAEVPVAWEG
jgi:hypothetical protein